MVSNNIKIFYVIIKLAKIQNSFKIFLKFSKIFPVFPRNILLQTLPTNFLENL